MASTAGPRWSPLPRIWRARALLVPLPHLRSIPMDSAEPGSIRPWTFGNRPLAQTLALAPVLRRLVATALSMEEEGTGMARLIEELSALETGLATRGPADPAPRIGPDARSDQRVYLD